MRMPLLVIMAALLSVLTPPESGGEVSVGVTGGLALSGGQDVKLKEFDGDGRLLSLTEARGARPSTESLGGLTVAFWGWPWSRVGVQVDALYWTSSVAVDGPTPGPTGSHLTADQARSMLLLSLLGRLPLGDPDSPYLYVGLGAGPVLSRVRPGDSELGPGIGGLGGIALPLTSRLRARIEIRYLITPDVDAGPRSGLRAETSGSSRGNVARPIFGPHLDTQFLPLLVGIDWLF